MNLAIGNLIWTMETGYGVVTGFTKTHLILDCECGMIAKVSLKSKGIRLVNTK